jgi:cytochrome c5
MFKRFFLLSLLISAPYTCWAIDPFTIELYQSSCIICHEGGAGGAPKSFDEDEWRDRLAKGNDVLLQNAISGFKGMPPLGMCSDCTQEDLVDLIAYISAKQVGE